MDIIRTITEEEFDCTAAELILSQMKVKPDSVIGLSTGRTTGNMHRIASDLFKADPFDVSRLTFFAIDEVTGIPNTNPWACYAKLKREIIDNLGLRDDQFITLPTDPDDVECAAQEFYSAIRERGGIDLIVLGLGENGHLGFNHPGTPFSSRISEYGIDSDLDSRIRSDCGMDGSVHLGGITIGLADIMESRRLLLAVKGLNKRPVLDRVINGPVSEAVPASILRKHPDCTVLADYLALSD